MIPRFEETALDDLNHEGYVLLQSITIELEYAASGVIARYRPVDMYGAGATREDAILELQSSLTAYYACLLEMGEGQLGPQPHRHWQQLNHCMSRKDKTLLGKE